MHYRPTRRVLIAGSVILLLVVVSILLLPEILRRIAISRLEKILSVPVNIADVDLNLFTARAHVDDFVIGHPENPILYLPDISTKFSRTALLTGRIDLTELFLQKPAVTIERTEADRYNIDVFRRQTNEADARAPDISVDRIEVHDGRIVFVDRTRDPDYKLNLVSLELAAGPISTMPQADGPVTGFNAGFKIGDGSVSLSGESRASQRPISAELNAKIEGVELAAFRVYLPHDATLRIEDSRVNGDARYFLRAREGTTAEHALTADLSIGGIGLLSDPNAQPVVTVSGLKVQNLRMDFLHNKTAVERLILENPNVRLEKDTAGLNLAGLFAPSEAAKTPLPAEAAAPQAGARMTLDVERVEASNGTVEFVDRTVEPIVAGSFHDADILARNVSLLPTFELPDLALSASTEQGSLNLTGTLAARPLEGQFTIIGKQLPFSSFGGYLKQLFRRTEWSGDTLNGELKLALRAGTDNRLGTEISGNISGERMSLRFPTEENAFLSSRHVRVEIRSLRAGQDGGVDIDRIELSGANLRVLRQRNGTLNLSRLWTATDEAPRDENGINQNNRVIPLVIRRITVNDSEIVIHDTRVSPDYSTRLSRLTLQVANLSRQVERATVDLEGVLGGSGNLALTGWFRAFAEKPVMHLEGTIKGYALPPLNPYAMEYVSHRIESGEISTEVTYNFKAGEFEADANVVLQHVGVGERTGDEFNQRIGIPLELAVALLEDINGVIRLRLQFSGESGAQISIANLVWTAVRNAIVNAISAPFRLIGNVLTLGGRIGGLQIEPILFKPGVPEIQAQSSEQVDALSELLREKPQIKLRLNGTAVESDIEALKQAVFWRRIQAAKGKDYQSALVDVYKTLGGVTEPRTPLSVAEEASLERFVMERITIPKEEIDELARIRAELVRRELVEQGVDPDRLATSAQTGLASDATPRVSIELAS